MPARRLAALAALTLASALASCAGDPATTPVPAAGTVTYKGKPLASGTIQLVPAQGRPASGAIKDGKFTLTTNEENDGAIVGKHSVVVAAYEDVKVKGSAEPEQKLVTPEKYANATSSGLSVDIPPGGKTDIAITLE